MFILNIILIETNMLLLSAGLLKYVSTEGIVSKYYIKIRCKSNQEGERNSLKL